MEVHHVHQSGTHAHTLFLYCSRKHRRHGRWRYIMFISQVHKHIQSLFNTQDKTDAMADGVTSCSSVRYTHTYVHFNFRYITDAKSDGDTSCSSVRYTYIHHIHTPHTHTTYTLSLILKIKQTSWQMEIHHVHQSGTHTYDLFLILKKIQTPWQMELHHVHQSGTHTHTLSLIFDILQTPRQMDIHGVHQSGTHTRTTYTHHTHSLFNTQDTTDVTVDGDTSFSSVRYIHTSNISLLLQIIQAPRQMEIHHVHQSGTSTHTLSIILKIKTDATADGDALSLSIRYTHTHKFSLILKIIQTPRQM